MSYPESLPTEICALLAACENLAFLVVDSSGEIRFASPESADYGVAAQRLSDAPPWLSEAGRRWGAGLAREAIWQQQALDHHGRPVSILARAMVGPGHVLVLLRRPGERFGAVGAYHPDTGLYSYAHMKRRLSEELARTKRYADPLGVLGISCTDGAGTELVDLMKIHFRGVDIVGHAQSEGFLVILPETNLEQARIAGQRFRSLVTDWRATTPGLSDIRYTAVAASGTETAEELIAALAQAEPQPA